MSTATTSGQKFATVVEQIGRTVTATGTIIDRVSQNFAKFGQKLAIKGGALGAALGGATYQAIQFDGAMRNVFTVANKADGSFGKMSAAVLKLSRTLPQSSGDLARGLYDIESSGFKGAEALDILNQSAISASAGLSSTATAAGTIDAILNAYGKSASEAADVSDILFQTVNVGVLTFEELASTTGEWVSMAASAKVPVDQASAALAAMTLSGMNAAEASTSLSRVLTEFLNPGEGMVKILEQMGYASGTALLESRGLYGAMNDIRVATGGASDQLVKVFGDIRGARGAMALMTNDGENFASTFGAITDEATRAGAAMTAFKVQAGGPGAQMTLLKNNISAISIELGQTFLPAMTMASKILGSFIGVIADIPGPVKKTVAVLATFASVTAVVGGLILAWRIKSLMWSGAWRVMAWAVKGLSEETERMWAKGALLKLHNAFERIAKTGGPLGSMLTASKVGFGLLGRMLGPVITNMIKFGGVALIAAGAFWLFQRNIGNARKEGEKLAKDFLKSMDTSTIDALNDSIKQTKERIMELDDAMFQGQQGSISRLGSVGNWQKAFAEMLTGSNSKAKAEQDALIKGMKDMADEALKSQMRVDQAMGVIADPAKGTAAEARLNRLRSGFKAFAEGKGLKTTITVDFAKDPAEYNRQADALQKSLGELWAEFNNGKPAEAELKGALFDLGQAFDEGKSKIEGLSKVLDAFFAKDFGMAEANDAVEGGLNELYKKVQDFKDKGTLSEALKAGSFHEDAISLRGDMRSIVKDIGTAAVEWAKTQENLTGDQFLNHMKEQAAAFMKSGQAAGLSDEYLQPYVNTILEIANTKEVSTKFNSNVATQSTEVGKYLAQLGLADTEITTAINIYKTQGEQALKTWLIDVHGASADQVTTTVKLIDDQATKDLEAWRTSVNLSNDEINTLVKLQFSGDDKALKAELTRLGITDAQYKAFVDIVGSGSTDQALGILNAKLDEVERLRTVKFNLDQSIFGEINNLDQALNALQWRMEQVSKLNKTTNDSIWSMQHPTADTSLSPTGAVTKYFGYTANAEGGLHTAQISKRMRLWAEPETGGEAYIPLSPAKRNRSLSIWAQTGKALGVKGFADGGTTDFSQRVYTAPTKDTGGTKQDPWQIVVNMHTVGDMSDGEFRAALAARLETLTKYSDDWQSTWNDLKSFDDDAAKAEEDKWKGIAGAFQNAFDTGNVDPGQYKAWLESQLATQQKYSDEWTSTWNKLNSFNDNVKKKEDDRVAAEEKRIQDEQAAMAKEERIWEYRNTKGEINNADYLKLLRDRISKETQYSDRWYDLQSKIDDMEQKVIDDQSKANDERKRLRDVMFDAGAMSRDAYLAELRKDLAATKMYSDEWQTITKQVEDMTGAGAVKAMGNVTTTPFTNSFVSGNAVVSYFEKQATKALKWASVMSQLKGAGVSDTIMAQLIGAGPDSLPMAEALVRVYNDPAQKSRFEAAQQTISTVSGSFSAAPQQPAQSKGMSIQSGGYQGPGFVVQGPLVQIEKYETSNANDAKQVANEISFQIRSQLG